nr:hypothetical protein [uncultured Roseococcus sp.]
MAAQAVHRRFEQELIFRANRGIDRGRGSGRPMPAAGDEDLLAEGIDLHAVGSEDRMLLPAAIRELDLDMVGEVRSGLRHEIDLGRQHRRERIGFREKAVRGGGARIDGIMDDRAGDLRKRDLLDHEMHEGLVGGPDSNAEARRLEGPLGPPATFDVGEAPEFDRSGVRNTCAEALDKIIERIREDLMRENHLAITGAELQGEIGRTLCCLSRIDVRSGHRDIISGTDRQRRSGALSPLATGTNPWSQIRVGENRCLHSPGPESKFTPRI